MHIRYLKEMWWRLLTFYEIKYEKEVNNKAIIDPHLELVNYWLDETCSARH